VTIAKGFVGLRTVTMPRAVWHYVVTLAFAGLVGLIALAGLGVYFGVVLATRPDVPLLAPNPVPRATPKGTKP